MIIAPSPMLKDMGDQTEVRKALNDIASGTNRDITNVLSGIKSTVYPEQTVTTAGGVIITIPSGYNVPVSGTIGNQMYQLWPDGVMHLCGSTGDIGQAGQDIGGNGATYPGRWWARANITYAITFYSIHAISTGYVSQGWVSTAYGGDSQTNTTLTLISWFNDRQTAGWSATFETWGRWKE